MVPPLVQGENDGCHASDITADLVFSQSEEPCSTLAETTAPEFNGSNLDPQSEDRLPSPILSNPSTSQIHLPLLASPPSSPPKELAPSDVQTVGPVVDGFELPPEVATADISIAHDGSFLETSSGAAARELKRRYDHYLGVGKDIRSPYAITAFINQHGKQMYRVGPRELSAPAASAEDAENRVSIHHASSEDSRQSYHYAPHTRRRSRMSVHSFLPSSVFKTGPTPATHAAPSTDGTRSPPIRKLRKTRSIPNQLSAGSNATAKSSSQGLPIGRPHAHSVSSADAFRAPLPPVDHAAKAVPQRDFFADVMSWPDPSASTTYTSSASLSRRSLQLNEPSTSSRGQDEPPDLLVYPFGPGVSFDSPSWTSASHLPSAPTLREMQSFESGMTARADRQNTPLHASTSRVYSPGDSEKPLSEVRTSTFLDAINTSQPKLTPRDETIMHSPYSSEVFDILQTSRGLPSLDRISATSQETTIKLSLKADDSAAPRDDPRFVIWGEVDGDEPDNISRTSNTDLSSNKSDFSRKKSLKARNNCNTSDASSIPASSRGGPVKMLVAATIERWIAQLTSELDYDELLVFFLTYRTYISALDLGHLLICRFHWALGEPASTRDEMVRRIVRVRTFTAIRHWVVTFFDADFVPNRELRLLFANWLNSLRKDPILQRHKDALKIVRQLRKVFLECKDAHLRRILKQPARKAGNTIPRAPVLHHIPDAQLPESARRLTDVGPEDFDIDLDFDGGTSNQEHSLGVHTTSASPLSSGPVDLSMLRQPLHLAFLQYGNKSPAALQASSANPVLLPMPHNTLSRVLVNTIGRLGRWKRVLNSRATGRTPLSACLDVSAFDIEASETGDLLLVRGGVEQYLKMVDHQMSQVTLVDRRDSADTSTPVVSSNGHVTHAHVDESHLTSSEPGSHVVPDGDEKPATSRPEILGTEMADSSMQRASSVVTGPDDILRTPIGSESAPPFYGPPLDVVSIDELDLSDLSSDENVEISPPGLKRLPRRLPTRRDFEFVRQSTDSVSSMGIRTHESMISAGSSSSAGGDMGGPIQMWHVNALVDSLSDEEEAGDVDAALRRLEGQINEERQRAKQYKVDKWVRSIQERQAGRFGSPRSDDSSDEDDYGDGEWRHQPVRGDVRSRSPSGTSLSRSSSYSSVASMKSSSSVNRRPKDLTTSPAKLGSTSDQASAPPVSEAKPVIEDAVPLEILRSRLDSTSVAKSHVPHNVGPSALPLQSRRTSAKLSHPESMRRHHSFVLTCRTETLMQHFSMIDRELFLNIRFEELVVPHVMDSAQDTNVLDWAHFLTERARLKAEGRVGHQTGSLTVVRGRFNLLANFVLSEIVLTHPNERMRIFTKFIRLAWKAYELKNFNALVAIIAGLRSHWVVKAMQQCPDRLRLNDKRILDDLSSWTSKAGHFMHIRQTIDALTQAKPIEVNTQDVPIASADGQSTRSRAASESKPSPAPACVPFFGVYLSQLQQYTDLPELIDPTAPHEPVGIDPVTNSFEALAHPEVFSTLAPLPPSIQLEPLINVHKQRLVASIVKSFVAAQHLASRVQYPLDKKLFQRCLKLRGLDTDTLERALALYAH